MTLDGISYNPESKREAERYGIRMVMQELNVIPTLTIAENIFLTDLPNRFGYIDKSALNEGTEKLLEQVGMSDVRPDTKVSELGLGKQQLVEIAGGLSKQCKLLILDEPTAALTEPEVQNLFRQIKKLKESGASIIYISHRLEEVMQVSDTITVLRDGKLIKTKPALEFTLDEMVMLMVGRELEVISHRKTASGNNLLMRVEDVSAPTGVKNVSFELMRGEVLGFAGLMGSGRTELMRAVFGADSKTSGRIFIKDLDNPILIKNPSDAVRNGIAMLPESRKEQGLFYRFR
jgi:ribose transport system ATP-binding protein